MVNRIELVDPKRSAHASIRGYLYQACLGVERWLSLREGEVLLCEGDEDLDRLLREKGLGVIEQVKALVQPVGDRVLRESLQRFAVTYVALRQRKENRQFVFTTTAERSRSGQRFNGVDPMSYWANGRKDLTLAEQAMLRGAVRHWLGAETPGIGDAFIQSLAGALAWLDRKADRLEKFLDRVEWHFGSPDLDGIRAVIKEKLQKRSDASALPLGEVLVDWLVSRVLDASRRPQAEERVLTRELLDKLLIQVTAELSDWASNRLGVQLRNAFEELASLEKLLRSGIWSLPLMHPDHARGDGRLLVPRGKLLTAGYEVVPFEEEARAEELADLEAWCNKERPRMAWLWTGEAGAGKTRLAIELCRRLCSDGWEAGFLRAEADQLPSLAPLIRGVVPRLIVLDDAQAHVERLKVLLRLAGETLEKPPKLRILLLARKVGAWWGLLKATTAVEDLLWGSPEPRQIRPLFETYNKAGDAYMRAIRAFCNLMNIPEPCDSLPAAYSESDRAPLFLHMQALEAAESGESPRTDNLLARILDRERELWRSTIQDFKRHYGHIPFGAEDMIESTMAGITMFGGVSSRKEAELVAETATGRPLASDDLRFIIEVLRRLYSGIQEDGQLFVQALRPDLLGEELLAQHLTGGQNG